MFKKIWGEWEVEVLCICLFFYVWEGVSLCSPGYLRTFIVDQAGPEHLPMLGLKEWQNRTFKAPQVIVSSDSSTHSHYDFKLQWLLTYDIKVMKGF